MASIVDNLKDQTIIIIIILNLINMPSCVTKLLNH